MIRLTLLDNTKKEVELFDEITENDNILEIDCMVPGIDCWTHTDEYSNVRLTLLPENMNFPNLIIYHAFYITPMLYTYEV